MLLPVTGLPLQVTVQSTPASVLSPTGVMLTFAVAVTPRDVSCPEITPLASVMEMRPAFVLEPLPQPERQKRATANSKELRPAGNVLLFPALRTRIAGVARMSQAPSSIERAGSS